MRGLQTRTGTAITHPTENLCSRRTRKATADFASHEENWFVFSRSQRSSAPNKHRNSENRRSRIVAKHYVSEGNTRRLLRESEDDETPKRVFFASEEAHREPAESVVYFRSGILYRSLVSIKTVCIPL